MNRAVTTMDASARGSTIVFIADSTAHSTSATPPTVATTRRTITAGESAPSGPRTGVPMSWEPGISHLE